jgi:hypothetical protein|tara:strand:+ start:1435 stop:2361 length:927 start_codon:yes stop_codon:yes gene_type:complete
MEDNEEIEAKNAEVEEKFQKQSRKRKKGQSHEAQNLGINFFSEKYKDSEPTGRNVWWIQPSPGNVSFGNLPNVLSCICGDHPFPVGPPMGKTLNGKIRDYLHCGLPRSGSTVVWQIMDEVFPDEVVRSHEFYDVCPLLYDFKKIICCVRHPYDVYSSLLRTSSSRDVAAIEKEFSVYMGEIKKWLLLQHLKVSVPAMVNDVPDILYIKYEDYYGQDLKRVKSILEYLCVDIDNIRQNEIAQKFSVDKNEERAATLSDFSEVDKKTQIHGNHIGAARGAIFSSSLNEENKQKIQETYQWFFDIFNYTHY